MRLPLLLACLALSTCAALAQKAASDYLVTTAGDTVRGRVQPLSPRTGKVRLYREGMPPAEFGAAEASSYGSATGPIAVSRRVGAHGSPRFLRPLVAGRVSAYSGENDQQETRYYLQPTDSAYVVEVSPVTAQLTYARLLSGCPALEFGSNTIQAQYPYTTMGVSKLVMAYNRCREPQATTQVVRRDRGLPLAFGLKAGLNTSDFSLPSDDYRDRHTGATGFQVGTTLNLATRTHFSVQLEAVYVWLRSSYSGIANSYNSGILSNSVTTNMRFSQLQIPLLVRYSLGHGWLRPYLNAGPSMAFNFANTSSYTTPTTPTTAREVPIELNSSSIGATAGVGLTVQRPALPALHLELRYDRMIDNRDYRTYTPKHSAFRLDLGIAF